MVVVRTLVKAKRIDGKRPEMAVIYKELVDINGT